MLAPVILEIDGRLLGPMVGALAAAVGVLLAAQRRSLLRGAVAGGVALIGMAFTALFVASLADAVDVPRHHLLFYALFDMLVVVLVHLSVRAWLARTRTA